MCVSLPGRSALHLGYGLQQRNEVEMVQLEAVALAGNEPQAAPRPGVSPSCCLWPWQKCRLFRFCPACYEASSSSFLFSPGEPQRAAETSFSIQLD